MQIGLCETKPEGDACFASLLFGHEVNGVLIVLAPLVGQEREPLGQQLFVLGRPGRPFRAAPFFFIGVVVRCVHGLPLPQTTRATKYQRKRTLARILSRVRCL